MSQQWLHEEGTFTARKNVQLLREFAARPPRGSGRRIVLRFLRSPVAIRGDGRVTAIDIQRNEIVRSDDGAIRARAADDAVETIECGLVLRSVGYRAIPLPDVPFDERAYVLPNDRGRVLGADGEPVPGVYTVGWIKRGPTGILGTNKRDAQETVRCLVEDLRAAAARAGRGRDRCTAARRRRDGRRLARDRRARARTRPCGGPPARQAGVARRAAGTGHELAPIPGSGDVR